MSKRIVITGLGVVSSIGIGRGEFWNSLIAGKSGISEVSCFDTSAYPTHKGGEVKNFNPEVFLPKERINLMGRSSQLAVSAARLALEDSKLSSVDKEKTGVCCGTTMGETQLIEQINNVWINKGLEEVDAELVQRTPCNAIVSNVAIEFGLNGPNLLISNACAAGNFAVGMAYDLISSGEAETMFAGGSDAFSRIAFTGFNQMFAVAPEKCQPFDKNRKGMMVAEGAAFVILETLENALKRKAEIYAEILGYGVSSDAHHMTAPYSEGIARAMEMALSESKVRREEVSYLNAHGTGTPSNDREECLAIKKVFGDYYKKLPVSSIKSMLGHTMGAASAIETVACSLAVKNDTIPPTINYDTLDPECDIDCVPNEARKTKVDIALNSASAFGGNNACLVLKKYRTS